MGNGNSQDENNDSKRRQNDQQRKERERQEAESQRKMWNKWLNEEKERQKAEWQWEKDKKEREWQRERANRERELEGIEEANRMKLEQKRASEKTKKKEKKIKELRNEVTNLKPGDSIEFPGESISLPRKLNVGLFGTTGIGKSSLLNSLKFAMKGELTELMREQTSTANFQGGNTVRRLPVDITKYLAFIDNRGVGAEDLETIDAANEIISQLEGRSSFAEKVEWRKESRRPSNKTLFNKDERIYCTVLVFDAQNPHSVYMVLNKLVTEIFEWQGRYPIGVITHVDVATPEQLENMYVVLNSAGLADTYEVSNITSDNTELSLDHQLNLLRLMQRCIKEGDRIFSLREEIERQEVQQTMEREREADEARQKQARLEKEREEARKAEEAEEARIEKEKEKEKARIEKEKKAEEAKIEKDKKAQEARIEKEKEEAIEKAKLELIETFEKEKRAEEARIEKEKKAEEARIEKEKEQEEAIEKVKLELIEKFEKDRLAREAKENKLFYFLGALIFLLIIIWLAV